MCNNKTTPTVNKINTQLSRSIIEIKYDEFSEVDRVKVHRIELAACWQSLIFAMASKCVTGLVTILFWIFRRIVVIRQTPKMYRSKNVVLRNNDMSIKMCVCSRVEQWFVMYTKQIENPEMKQIIFNLQSYEPM